MPVEHFLIKPGTIETRDYQANILNTALRENTLCVLPTGLGKTTLAILVAANRLERYPNKKILIMSPTRPLCAQHQKSFRECLNIDHDDIVLVTGFIRPENRGEIYKDAKVIVATPQTIENDMMNRIIDLGDFSLVVFDECHRAVKDYAYTAVAHEYGRISDHLILGLTASPGASEEKIKQICKNLSIGAVEIRTEVDGDVKPYVKKTNIEWLKINLSENLKFAQANLKAALNNRIERLKEYKIHVRTKREVLEAQQIISRKISKEKRPIYYFLASLTAETIKIWHLLELLETQSVRATKKYLNKIREKKTTSDKRILNDEDIRNAILRIERSEEHPKLEKLEEIVADEVKGNKNIKVIVFSHYRDNIEQIFDILTNVTGCLPVILIGQAGEKGLSQKEQIEIVKDYEADVYNTLITSPIGEEGLHLASADLAIFYDSVPSEIRTIQRRGRVGRTKVGKIIFLLTKGTRDESYYWVAQRKEKRMKTILKEMQRDRNLSYYV